MGVIEESLRGMRMPSPINQTWKIIKVGPESVIELRAFHYAGKSKVFVKIFRASDFESVESMKCAFERQAADLNAKGYNIYIVMNPIKSDFNGYSAKDKDIFHRTLLLIDIDRTDTAAEPASNEEVRAAKSLADGLSAFLAKEGWPKPILVMSGNGWHLYYKLDQLINDDENKGLIHRILKLLADRFNNPVVKIDPVVYNASRITKVPGTVMRKGEESDGRPYREAMING